VSSQFDWPTHIDSSWHVGHCDVHAPLAQEASGCATPSDMHGHLRLPRFTGVDKDAGKGDRRNNALLPYAFSDMALKAACNTTTMIMMMMMTMRRRCKSCCVQNACVISVHPTLSSHTVKFASHQLAPGSL